MLGVGSDSLSLSPGRSAGCAEVGSGKIIFSCSFGSTECQGKTEEEDAKQDSAQLWQASSCREDTLGKKDVRLEC